MTDSADFAGLPTPPEGSGFAARLNWLFEHVHPADSDPYTNAAVVRAIVSNPTMYGKVRLSEQHMSLLRQGKRDASEKLKKAISRFFGVPSGYLIGDIDPITAGQVENEVQALALVLRDQNIRHIALRSHGLPEDMTDLVLGILGQMRGRAGLGDASPPGPLAREEP